MADIYLRNGSSVYQARIRVGPEVRRVSTGAKDPGRAQQTADRLEQEANDALIMAGDVCVVAAAARFFEERSDGKKKLAPRTVDGYEKSLIHIVGVLHDFPLRRLTTDQVRHYISERKKVTSTIQIRRDLAFLSSLLTWAQDWDCGVEENVVRQVNKRNLADAKEHDRWLTRSEVDKLIAACTRESHRAFITLAVFTGMRHQELLKLSWAEIDLKEGWIHLGGARTKNSSSRHIPMTPEVLSTLSSTPEAHRRGYVFKGKEEGEAHNNMGARWRKIRKRAGLPDVRIHTLRHTFASWLKQEGVAETTIMDLMGHKTRSMVKRYAHDSNATRQDAVCRISASTLSSTRSNRLSNDNGKDAAVSAA